VRVLLHLGLNKCASTYIQSALDAARPALLGAGVCYPAQPGPSCQYGLSRAYGFGPDAPDIARTPVAGLVAEAAGHECDRLILSSEYLSLYRPAGAARLAGDLVRAGCRTQFLLFSRPVPGWVRSLFNQYVRTVDDGRPLPNIDAFVDQVLANGAIDIARRHDMWAKLAGSGGLTHHRISDRMAPGQVLGPFTDFAGIPIPAPKAGPSNASLGADQLHRIGELWRQPACTRRDREIGELLAGAPSPVPAPPDYLVVGAERMASLHAKVIAPYMALSWTALPAVSVSPGTARAA